MSIASLMFKVIYTTKCPHTGGPIEHHVLAGGYDLPEAWRAILDDPNKKHIRNECYNNETGEFE